MPSLVTFNLDSLDFASTRALVWEAMRSKWKHEGYSPVNPNYRAGYRDICFSVAELAARKGIIQKPHVPSFQPYLQEVSEIGRQRIGSVLWSLVAQEILYIDMPLDLSSGKTSLVFDITEYGLQVLSAGIPIPHDPDGYLSYIKSEIPNIDATVYTYISESINAYNHNLLLSATTAIGCASEKALLLLLEAYIPFLPSEKERESFLKRTKGKFIKIQFEEFQKSFAGQKSRVDKELTDGIDIVISGIFELLRQNRNSTGHPIGKLMSKDRVFASLQLFVTYCKRIYELIDFFNDAVVGVK